MNENLFNEWKSGCMTARKDAMVDFNLSFYPGAYIYLKRFFDTSTSKHLAQNAIQDAFQEINIDLLTSFKLTKSSINNLAIILIEWANNEVINGLNSIVVAETNELINILSNLIGKRITVFKINEYLLERLYSRQVPNLVLQKLKSISTQELFKSLKSKGVDDDILGKLRIVSEKVHNNNNKVFIIDNTVITYLENLLIKDSSLSKTEVIIVLEKLKYILSTLTDLKRKEITVPYNIIEYFDGNDLIHLKQIGEENFLNIINVYTNNKYNIYQHNIQLIEQLAAVKWQGTDQYEHFARKKVYWRCKTQARQQWAVHGVDPGVIICKPAPNSSSQAMVELKSDVARRFEIMLHLRDKLNYIIARPPIALVKTLDAMIIYNKLKLCEALGWDMNIDGENIFDFIKTHDSSFFFVPLPPTIPTHIRLGIARIHSYLIHNSIFSLIDKCDLVALRAYKPDQTEMYGFIMWLLNINHGTLDNRMNRLHWRLEIAFKRRKWNEKVLEVFEHWDVLVNELPQNFGTAITKEIFKSIFNYMKDQMIKACYNEAGTIENQIKLCEPLIFKPDKNEMNDYIVKKLNINEKMVEDNIIIIRTVYNNDLDKWFNL